MKELTLLHFAVTQASPSRSLGAKARGGGVHTIAEAARPPPPPPHSQALPRLARPRRLGLPP